MWHSAKIVSLAVALAGVTVPAGAETRYRSVSVDTSVIAAQDNPVLAQNIRAALQADLNRSFADRLTNARNAPVLVVKVTGISQSSLPDGSGARRAGNFGGQSDSDYLQGEALVVSGRRVVASYPMLSALDSNYAGGWYQADADRKRLSALTWHYAAWLRHEIGGL